MICLYVTFERVHSTWLVAREKWWFAMMPQISKETCLPSARSCRGWAVGRHPVMPPPFSHLHCNLNWGNGRRQAQSNPDFKTATVKFYYYHNSVHSFSYLFPCWRKKNKEKQREKKKKRTQPKAPRNTGKINKVGCGTSALKCTHLTWSS